MRFLHLADLHLGKRVNGFDMLEDQRFILEQVLALCQEHGVEVTVIDRTGVAAGSSWGNAGWLTPGLTTVRQQISLKGQRAVELLLKHIAQPDLTKQEEILPLQLVERGSVRRLG